MRLAAQLYYQSLKLIGRGRNRAFNRYERFDRLYQLDADPFALATSSYEKAKVVDVLSVLEKLEYRDVLDIGCGTGVLTRELAKRAGHIDAIDFSSQAIFLAKQQPNPKIDYAIRDVCSIEEEASYDLIVCSEVLYYLTSTQLEQAVTILRRALRTNGRLLIVGKSKDDYVRSHLTIAFTLESELLRPATARPYAVSVFTPRS